MAKRQLSLAIDLGGEQIELERVEAIEALGRPFLITVDLFASLGELNLMPHLGKSATIRVAEDDVEMRFFHGMLVEGDYLSLQPEGHHYRLTLRPWTFLLSQNRNFAIYQDMSTLDIVMAAAREWASKIDSSGLSSHGRTRRYCVQYGESDFAFMSRLLEEEGIYYRFEHKNGDHKMMLCDQPSSHHSGLFPTLTFNPNAADVANSGSAARSAGAAKRFLEEWSERVATGGEAKVTTRDFDFEKPKAAVEAVESTNGTHPQDDSEVYVWPGAYTTKADGQTVAKVILESRRAHRQTYHGVTQVAALKCGEKFTLEAHKLERFNRGYLVTRTHHILASEALRSGGRGGTPQVVHFEAVPDDVKWRSPQISPRPVVRGPETAVITGPDREEIYTDEYGRVKVRFHWDRSDTKGEESTCWLRVSQTGGLGNIILPRVGHEVIVDFLDGDPDRPIVVGRVFNKDHMPVYALPEHKTKALWRTLSYKEGKSTENFALTHKTGNPGANELRFEDKAGEEEYFQHAQRDMNTRIRRSETHHIGLDQGIKMGGSRDVKIAETDVLDVGKSIKVNAGTTIDIEAKSRITLKVGSSTIEMTPTSIEIKSGQITVQASATLDAKSPITTVKGDGTLTLKGGMTLIN